MEWLPPGRGLWAMGTDAVYERGAMPLYNCAYTDIGEDWVEDVSWIMDVLMNGVGVGFGPKRCGIKLFEPSKTCRFIVPDTREGWVALIENTLDAFYHGDCLPEPDVSKVRPAGSPIKTFGGTASGPGPLLDLYRKIVKLSYRYVRGDYDEIQYKTDLANLVGVCVISGNVRRSAELCAGEIDDTVFMHLKNYKMYPERADWGWMSNNSVRLREPEDFESLDEIAQANADGHDVGYINMRNLPHGRIGKIEDPIRYGIRPDRAVGLNPCGEIPLEHREVCNLAETLPTRCVDEARWLDACEYATFYCSTVALLPTHQSTTNAVVNRNRRIGVSIIDFTGWKHYEGVATVTRSLRNGYDRIRAVNRALAEEAGVPPSLRVTTVKPGGTVPKVAGRTSGAGHPTFHYTVRRVIFGAHQPIFHFLKDSGIPYEPSQYTKDSYVFEFPILQGPAEPAEEVSVWEQAMNVVLLQREWADNAVSNTLYFTPEERNQLESVLAAIAPLTKSVSLLPHSDTGIFPQMPEEGITREEYERRLAAMPEIDWTEFEGGDGEDEKFCVGDTCNVVDH
jgi:ribonucleoside-diphosphate reductase alpha chain